MALTATRRTRALNNAARIDELRKPYVLTAQSRDNRRLDVLVLRRYGSGQG